MKRGKLIVTVAFAVMTVHPVMFLTHFGTIVGLRAATTAPFRFFEAVTIRARKLSRSHH